SRAGRCLADQRSDSVRYSALFGAGHGVAVPLLGSGADAFTLAATHDATPSPDTLAAACRTGPVVGSRHAGGSRARAAKRPHLGSGPAARLRDRRRPRRTGQFM